MASNFCPDEELSEIATKLWELDENRCEPGVDYEIDIQGYVTSARTIRKDRARENLFTWLDEDKVFSKDTYRTFRALLDNYETEGGRAEVVTEQEEQENWAFLDAMLDTPVMQEVHSQLVSHDKAPEDRSEFRWLLYKIWFKLYRRLRGDRNLDSSGFEHVFVGETRDRSVTGFHNWIQFYLQEKRGLIDYKGYFRRGTSEELEEFPRLMTLQFTWKNNSKPIGSSFIGCSPEFEMGLYTLLFLLNESEKTQLQIAEYKVEIRCYRHGRGIGTTYPSAKE